MYELFELKDDQFYVASCYNNRAMCYIIPIFGEFAEVGTATILIKIVYIR